MMILHKLQGIVQR